MAGGNERFEIRHGAAIIIGNRNFEPETGLPTRIGAEHDKYNAEGFCRAAGLRFPQQWPAEDIVRTDNLTLDEMRSLLEIISQYDFKDYDGFIAFVSSHGIEGELYTTDGETITIKEIVSTVEGNRSLEGKPKIFFLNNCLDQGMVLPDHQPNPLNENDEQADNPPSVEPIYVPKSRDVLAVYASVDGYENPRSSEHGSWGTRVLKEALAEHAFDMSLTQLLYIACNRDSEHERKQVFGSLSTLTKDVYFTPHSPL